MTSVAVLFDDRLRPETTGTYCRRALEELTRCGRIDEVAHVLPSDLSRLAAERGRWDVMIAVDDGLDYDFSGDLPPIAWWAIDTHLDFERALRRAQHAQWTFAAQRNGAERLRQQGIDAVWLPLACDPELHGRQAVEKLHDWCFVGNLHPGERQRLIHELTQRYPRSYVGNHYFAEMAGVYSASKVVFNRSLLDDVNMRVFEALGSGSLLLTNDLTENGLPELFQDGVHLATYRTDEELFDKLSYYLIREEPREGIAAAGRAEVLAKHTYRHRMERLLDVVEMRQNAGSIRRARNHHLQVKSAGYFEFDRPDVQELVPITARRILDIGCGAGRLGAALKARQPAHVTGVELTPRAAAVARTQLDDVRTVNVETDDLQFAEGQFDCVICADILEHLRQPERLLKNIRDWLAPDGVLVASVPNVRNHTVVQSLLAGNWTYESAGLLDADHVRFFTLRELEKLLFRAQFEVEDWRMVPGEGFAEWQQQGQPTEITVGGLQVRAASAADAAEFFAYQYLVRAVPQRVRKAPVQRRRNGAPGIARLARQFPWPVERPDVSLPDKHLGWFADGARDVLTSAVMPGIQLIVELGSWLGLSTRFLADLAPQAKIIAVDHWRGSPEHHARPELRALLDSLYEGFLTLSWDYRDRIQPLRLTTQEGLQAVFDAGLEPDLIYVDADHTYEAVRADIETSRQLFPDAVLTGDDFDHPDVQRAVREVAQADGLSLDVFGKIWRGWKLSAARPSSRRATSDGLTSIVIVTWNELPFTQMCLDSLRLRTDEPYELIVVDNGSTDGSVEWLRAQADVRLIENAENRGFPAAVNQGLRIARGENLLLLNNDTLLTTGWLRRMLDVLRSDASVGLVGPTSNYVGSEQEILVDYTHLANLDGFAWSRRSRLVELGEPLVQETERLIGFCLLFKREVLDAVGLLDERFGVGCFEDDDFCRRARQAGYRAVIARDAFIHHFGSVTFRASGADLGAILRENRRVYEQKWKSEDSRPEAQSRQDVTRNGIFEANGTTKSKRCVQAPRGEPRSAVVLAQDADGNLVIEPNSVHLSGCLIVRNNETTIRPCLESLKPWVDELIVVDTGSTDATPQIAEGVGARVFHWAWQDDFAAARNVSLDHARGEWLFWMDSDDVIPEECGRRLRDLADGDHPDHLLGYVMQVHCPGEDPADVTVVDHVKLFRNRPDLRFEFRIHEQILPAIRRAGGEVAFTDIHVVHAGYDRTAEGQAKKLERDFKLLNLELRDRPDHPFVLFNLGMTHADCGEHERAIHYLQRCLEVSTADESHVRKAYALLLSSLMQTQRLAEAEQVCRKGRAIFPDDEELLFRQAMLEHQQGRLRTAIATYREVLSATNERHFTSVDAGLVGFKARHNLAILHEEMDDLEAAVHEWRRITEEKPDYAPAWRGLIDAWVKLGREDEVARICAALADNPHARLRSLVHYGEGRQFEMRGEIDKALVSFAEADRLDPHEPAALHGTCRILFEAGRWSQARESLTELHRRQPGDASVLHNLGIAHWQLGDPAQAATAFRESLRLRPESAETWQQLATTLSECGQQIEAPECSTRDQVLSARGRGERSSNGS